MTPAILLLALATQLPGHTDTVLHHDRLQSIARQAYATLWMFHPVDATRSGFHRYDDRLGDYTPARVSAVRSR